MLRIRYWLAALAVSLVAIGGTASAAQADAVLPLTNWKVGGTLGVKKLNQNIQLPAGSTFNGSANFTQGTITGHTTIPDFTATIRVLGIPTQVALSVRETAPSTGTLVANSDGTVTTDVTVQADLRIRRLSLGLLGIPPGANCHTSSPVVLQLHDRSFIDLIKGFAFNGTYTIPRLTGCGLLTPTLNLLMAGPNNPFALTLKAPGAA